MALSPLQIAGRTPKLTRQPSIELPSMAVASTKSRWETGEVQAQSAAKSAPCKVGVHPGAEPAPSAQQGGAVRAEERAAGPVVAGLVP